MFIAEAKKYQVFPMDASVAARIVAPRPNITAGRTEFVYTRPMVGLPQGDSPLLLNTLLHDHRRHRGAAGRRRGHDPDLGRTLRRLRLLPAEGQAGVPVEHGRPRSASSGKARTRCTPGRHTVEFDFKYDGIGVGTLAFNNFSGLGQPGTGTLKVDGKVVATKRMEKTLPMILQWDESFDIGSDTLTGVNDADYKPPFALTAKLNKLTINRPPAGREDTNYRRRCRRRRRPIDPRAEGRNAPREGGVIFGVVPATGSAEWPPDDRLRRGIQHSRGRSD